MSHKSNHGTKTKIKRCRSEIDALKRRFSHLQKTSDRLSLARRKVRWIKKHLKAGNPPLPGTSATGPKWKIGQHERWTKRLSIYERKISLYEQELRDFPFEKLAKLLHEKEIELLTLENREDALNEVEDNNTIPKSGAPPLTNNQPKTKEPETQQVLADWRNIQFGNGYIAFFHKGRRYTKRNLLSQETLNYIKPYYDFKNVPRLEITIAENRITDIKNEQILFYHIQFLSTIGLAFAAAPIDIRRWNEYNKEHYRKHLPHLFQTQFLKRLCELCDESLPIIPAAELVINTSGNKTIHDSFLFPIIRRKSLLMIWESTVSDKASYVFEISRPCPHNTQLLYEYIVGDTVNKRNNLIHFYPLKKKLNLRRRLLHKSYDDWNRDLMQCLHVNFKDS